MEEKIFNYSQRKLEKQKQLKFTLLILMVLAVETCGLLFIKSSGAHPPIGIFLLFSVGSIALVALAGIISVKMLTKSLLNLKIRISQDYLERFTPNLNEKIAFKDLRKIVIVKNPDEKIRNIDLETDKTVLGIYGFENLEEIAEIVKSKAGAGAKVIERKSLFNWEDPKLITVYVIISMLIVFFGYDFWKKINYAWQHALMGLVWVLYGFSSIKFRFFSKYSGRKFRRFEVIFGSIMIVVGLSYLIGITRR